MTRRAGASVMKAIRDRIRHSSRNGMKETRKHGAGRVRLRLLLNRSRDGSRNVDLFGDLEIRLGQRTAPLRSRLGNICEICEGAVLTRGNQPMVTARSGSIL